MTFLEALYGSQYYEIHQKGKDGNKGRMNGNLFLAALIILLLLAVLLFCINFIPGFEPRLNTSTRSVFGSSGGRSIGKLVAIPLFALLYFILTASVGSKQNFKSKVEKFMQYPEEVKKSANKKILVPFFILGIIVSGLALMKAF